MIKRRLKMSRREGFKNEIISNGLFFFPKDVVSELQRCVLQINVKYKVPSVSSFM